MPEEYYYQVLSNVKDYGLTFPDYVQSVSLTQNALGNSAEIVTSGKAMGMDVQMAYSSDQSAGTFSADVTNGQFSGTTLSTALSKTYSFDGKNPTGATLVHAELKLHYGLLSLASLASDESIKFGLEQAIDKIGDRAKVLQQSSGGSQLVSTLTQSSTPPITPVTTQPSVTTSIPVPQPVPKPPIVTPQPTSPVTQPSTKLPTLTLYSSTVNGMSVTIYGNALSGTGKTLSSLVWQWGDGEVSFGQFPQSHTYAQSGTYVITVRATDSGLSTSATTNVSISTSSQPQPTTPLQVPQQTQPQPTVIVKTDLSSYKNGDTIVITGHITNPYTGQDVAIKVTSPSGNVVTADQVTLDNNGDFVTKISTVGNLWFENGQYTVTAQYVSVITQTTFSFMHFTPTNTPISTIISLQAPSHFVASGDIVTFTGKLSGVNGNGITNQLVSVKSDTPAWPDTTFGSAYTDAAGNFSIQWVAKKPHWYSHTANVYSSFEGSSAYTNARSSEISITVS